MFTTDPVRTFLPESYWDFERDYTGYPIDVTLAASASQQREFFQVDAGTDFLCLGLSFIAGTDAAGTTNLPFPEVTVRITDSASSEDWFNNGQSTHILNAFGNVSAEGIGMKELRQPRLVTAAASVNVYLTNLTANARRIWLFFDGVKIKRNIPRRG
jgi:hypothetical protein